MVFIRLYHAMPHYIRLCHMNLSYVMIRHIHTRLQYDAFHHILSNIKLYYSIVSYIYIYTHEYVIYVKSKNDNIVYDVIFYCIMLQCTLHYAMVRYTVLCCVLYVYVYVFLYVYIYI